MKARKLWYFAAVSGFYFSAGLIMLIFTYKSACLSEEKDKKGKWHHE